MNRDKNSKLFYAFAAGALIGAGILALFTTEKGKQVVKKTKDKLSNLSDDMKTKVEDLEKEVNDMFKGKESHNNPTAW